MLKLATDWETVQARLVQAQNGGSAVLVALEEMRVAHEERLTRSVELERLAKHYVEYAATSKARDSVFYIFVERACVCVCVCPFLLPRVRRRS